MRVRVYAYECKRVGMCVPVCTCGQRATHSLTDGVRHNEDDENVEVLDHIAKQHLQPAATRTTTTTTTTQVEIQIIILTNESPLAR